MGIGNIKIFIEPDNLDVLSFESCLQQIDTMIKIEKTIMSMKVKWPDGYGDRREIKKSFYKGLGKRGC